MDAQTIIRDIDVIYDDLKIMPILRTHMKRVAAVTWWIADHWQGPAVDKNVLVAAALVHDLGNIAKADFEWVGQEKLMGAEWKNREYWISVQKETLEKYGAREHSQLTERMIESLGVDADIMRVAMRTGFKNTIENLKTKDWQSKIITYADCRAAPGGIVLLTERMREAKKRYEHRDHEGLHSKEAYISEEAIYEIEKQLETHIDEPVSNITDDSIKQYFDVL